MENIEREGVGLLGYLRCCLSLSTISSPIFFKKKICKRSWHSYYPFTITTFSPALILVSILLCCLEISDSSWLPHLNLFTVFYLLDRIINLVVGSLTSLLILVTLISAFVFPQLPPKPLNIFFAVCISLSSITACILIYWYRQGDLEPKFRNLIYYILFSIIMLCICANLYFHDVGR
eukprot:XP_013974370.1 transmembrane protein 243 [Canis lupus familiaris]